jgi:hypothetical protein
MKRARPETPRVIIGDNLSGTLKGVKPIPKVMHFSKIFQIL